MLEKGIEQIPFSHGITFYLYDTFMHARDSRKPNGGSFYPFPSGHIGLEVDDLFTPWTYETFD